MKRISEVITVEETNKFKAGDIITIDAQTGAGKSYWIKNILYAIAKRDNKKILFLVHRKTCLDQFQNELIEDGKTDVIDIETYQHIDVTMKYQFKYNFGKYEYIVCDEMHYFFSDSWNRYSDLSLTAILNAKDKIRIFMSATGEKTKYYIKEYYRLETIEYELPRDYSYITHLEFYLKEETIHKYIRTILQTNEKAIVFIKSAQRAYELHKMYAEHSLFLCSEGNNLYKHVDTKKREEMLENEEFDKQILFTTLTLEAGVNIIDTSLKHIIIDIGFNIDGLLQALGRKRVQHKDDTVNLYLRVVTNKQLGGTKGILKAEYQFAMDFLFLNSDKKFVENNYRQHYRDLIYDEPTEKGIEKRLNITRFITIQLDLDKINEILDIKNGNLSYCKYISQLLGVDYVVTENEVQLSELEIYLNSMVGMGVELYKDEQWELIQKVGLKDKKGRLQKSISLINEYFKSNNMNYLIVSKSTKIKNDEGEWKSIRYWEVLKDIIHP